MKTLASARENLVGVCLMTDIPHELVIWGIKDIVQRYGQLYSTE